MKLTLTSLSEQNVTSFFVHEVFRPLFTILLFLTIDSWQGIVYLGKNQFTCMVITQKALRVVQDSGKAGKEVGLGNKGCSLVTVSLAGCILRLHWEPERETLTWWLGLRWTQTRELSRLRGAAGPWLRQAGSGGLSWPRRLEAGQELPQTEPLLGPQPVLSSVCVISWPSPSAGHLLSAPSYSLPEAPSSSCLHVHPSSQPFHLMVSCSRSLCLWLSVCSEFPIKETKTPEKTKRENLAPCPGLGWSVCGCWWPLSSLSHPWGRCCLRSSQQGGAGHMAGNVHLGWGGPLRGGWWVWWVRWCVYSEGAACL